MPDAGCAWSRPAPARHSGGEQAAGAVEPGAKDRNAGRMDHRTRTETAAKSTCKRPKYSGEPLNGTAPNGGLRSSPAHLKPSPNCPPFRDRGRGNCRETLRRSALRRGEKQHKRPPKSAQPFLPADLGITPVGATAYIAARWAVRGLTEASACGFFGDSRISVTLCGKRRSRYCVIWLHNPGSRKCRPKIGKVI